jgi:hypothetical protein
VVLWLDDLEPFLNAGMTRELLSEWHSSGPSRIVAATLGGKGSDLVVGSTTTALRTAAPGVLHLAREIALPVTSPSELAGLDVTPADHAAIERHGLAAYVVAGPALERKLSTGRHTPGTKPCPEGVALVRAAVDWARCGRTDPIRGVALRALWPEYLTLETAPAEEGFTRALAWALDPVEGSVGLLVSAGRDEAGYRAFDYVVRLIDDQPQPQPVRESCWVAACRTAEDAQAYAVGITAYRRGASSAAIEALERAWMSSIPDVAVSAGLNLGVVLAERGDHVSARAMFEYVLARFGDSEDPAVREKFPAAMANIGALS